MVNEHDKALMHHALQEAWKYQGLTFPNPAVGAVVSDPLGNVIGVGAHQAAGGPHAEVLALKEAYFYLTQDERILPIVDSDKLHTFLSLYHQNLFNMSTLHVTLEPCHHHGRTPPCSELIATLGLKRIVIGASDESFKAQGGGAFLQKQGSEVDFHCLSEKCKELLVPFTCKESHKPFVFFKLALSANNVASGGIISSYESRTMVHRLRDKCDLLVIGGNTVRTDRPILDARLCCGKAPDVLIYSHHKTFDRSIPLFSTAKREVFIEESLDKIKEYSMVMIEGGASMLKACQANVKWYLIFRSPHEKEGEKVALPQELREVFSQNVGEDTMTWYALDNG